jgi:transposase
LLTDDSQIGANLQVCADEENRADWDQRGGSRTIGAVGSRPQHAAEGGLEGPDRVAGERWTDSGGDCGGCRQEPADGPSLAPPLRGEGDGRAVEGCDPPSRVKPLSPEKIKQVVDMTLHAKPPNATHWSLRSMAAAAGLSYSSVQRIWRAHELKPHLVETFKVSRDKNFAAKVEDVVGLYLDPPDRALVFCVDEKSQIQALDRTQPGLPMKKGRAGTMTHDYKRNGTTTLFAALNMLDGKVIGTCMPRHRHREFLRFLRLIDQQTPAGLDLHLIVDNYATHKTPAVKRWLKAHPRFHLHFTPTSASWLNMVERFFAEITRKRIRRGAFKSVAELKSAIMEYLENHNADPKPFIWTKSAGQILEKVARAKQALESQH